MIDSCVLREPCWLEEYLDTAGVADQDWTVEIPCEVIDVVEAMHARGATLADIAARFAAAAVVHAEVTARDAALDGDPRPPYPLGGRWAPTPEAVGQVLEARGRRLRRQTTRPHAIATAKARQPEAQRALFPVPEQRSAS